MLKSLQMLATGSLIVASPLVLATEPAVALSFEDSRLEWGPCPEFIPKGCEIAVLHGNPAEENADIYFKVPPNFTIPRHWHSSAERMALVSGELHITYQGQPKTTLRPGMYAYGPARVPHEAVCVGDAQCVLFIAFEGPVDAVQAE